MPIASCFTNFYILPVVTTSCNIYLTVRMMSELYKPIVNNVQILKVKDTMIYTMLQACHETGMTYQGLKFYCNEGLVPNVKRDGINRRIFDERDIAWIKSLRQLRRCGMSIAEMKEYMILCLAGASSIPQRKTILAQTRKRLQDNIVALEKSLQYIDGKQEFYDKVLAGETEYVSNLLPCSCNLDRQ